MKPRSDRMWLTTADAARAMQLARTTVQRWIDAGELKAFRTVGGHRRVRRSDLLAFLHKLQMPIPAHLVVPTRLLVIDDEPHFVGGLGVLLKAAVSSIEVSVAQTGAEGLLAIGEHPPDAVLLDALLADIDGVNITRQLKRSSHTAAIVVVGISGRADSEAAFLRAGADAFLRKPFTASEVLQVLVERGVVEKPLEP